MKGCPLHCVWCHNPEGISRKKEIWYVASTCIGCESCVLICPEKALQLTSEGISIHREKCNGCYRCIEACPSKSHEKLGEDVTADYLMEIILKDKLYFQGVGGGVTITGGEPGIYADFIAELFSKCKQNGIQTAFDTSGAVSLEELEPVLRLSDLLFLDLKIIDKGKSQLYTGLDVSKLMDSLRWLKSFMLSTPDSPTLSIRTPLIPGLTDSDENLKAIAGLIAELGEENVDEWELCKFNNLCADKYLKLNKDWFYKNAHKMNKTTENYLALNSLFKKTRVVISGLGN
jgi:pyruvate formate lyase activating enzyme